MDSHLRQSLYFTTAFVAGVIATVGIQEILRFWRSSTSDAHSETDYPQYAADGITLRDSSLTGDEQPHTPRIVQGIEGCIGNTPLFRIKSLSDVTKCEILAKAEVIYSAFSASGDLPRE
jgi:cysteine synthase A